VEWQPDQKLVAGHHHQQVQWTQMRQLVEMVVVEHHHQEDQYQSQKQQLGWVLYFSFQPLKKFDPVLQEKFLEEAMMLQLAGKVLCSGKSLLG
jgi:hypothetical protein